jgi:hypothetical protein
MESLAHLTIKSLVLGILLTLLSACSDDTVAPEDIGIVPPDDPDPEPDPDPDPGPEPEGQPVTIPADGGMVVVEVDGQELTFDIPAGAVAEDTNIFVSSVAFDDIEVVEDPASVLISLNFEPSSVQFGAPVRVSGGLESERLDAGGLYSGFGIENGQVSSLPVNITPPTSGLGRPTFDFEINTTMPTVGIVLLGHRLSLTGPAEVQVGEGGGLQAELTREDSGITITEFSAEVFISDDTSPVSLPSGSSLTLAEFTPEPEDLERNGVATDISSFICNQEGAFSISIRAASGQAMLPDIGNGAAVIGVNTFSTIDLIGECLLQDTQPPEDITIAGQNAFNEIRLANSYGVSVSYDVDSFESVDPTNLNRLTAENARATTTTSPITDEGIAVNLNRLPDDMRSCITELPNVVPSEERSSTNYSAQISCPRREDGSSNPISDIGDGTFRFASDDREIVRITLEPGVGLVTQVGEGFNDFNDARINQVPDILYRNAANTNEGTSAALSSEFFLNVAPPQPFQTFDEGARPTVAISNFAGLNSEITIRTNAVEQLITFIETSEPGSDTLTGFIDVQPIAEPQGGQNSVTMNILRPTLVELISTNATDISDISIAAVNNQPLPSDALFNITNDPDNPLVSPNTLIGTGTSIATNLQGLTPEQVCPVPPPSAPSTRCSSGNREALLSVNLSDEVVIYDSITGQFSQFFLQDVDFSTPTISRTAAIEATQAPDQCVLYSDAGGQLLLFDTNGTQLTGDGLGNLNANGGALLTGRDQPTPVIEYLGYDFYSPDGGTTWQLFIAVRADTDGDASGFIDTTQVIRYDYALTGNTVLSNPVVIATEADSRDSFQDVLVIGDRVYVTQNLRGEQDPIRVFNADTGDELSPLLTDLTDPRQMAVTFDGNLAVVDFPIETFFVIDIQTGERIREFRLGDGDNRGNDRLRGIAPLRNGDFFASGLSDINRSVVNQYTGFIQEVRDNSSSNGVFVGRACLP